MKNKNIRPIKCYIISGGRDRVVFHQTNTKSKALWSLIFDL